MNSSDETSSFSSIDSKAHSKVMRDDDSRSSPSVKPHALLEEDFVPRKGSRDLVTVIPVMPSERGREVDIEKAALDEDEDRRLAIGSEPGSSKSSDAGVDLDAKESGAVQTSNGPVGELTWPDGGLEAWGNILGCTLISLTAFGQVNSFGVFQSHYASAQLATSSSSDISWIGGIQITILYISGLFFGRILDVYGARWLLIGGCLLSVFSICMLSLSTTYYQIFLSQGIGLGLGVALQFYPLVVIPSHWFRRKRAAAVGIVVAGSSIGGIIFPIMLSRLFDSIGFAWAVRAMALLMLGVQAVSIPLIKERLPPSKNRKVFDWRAFKDVKFALHCASGFFSAFGVFTPFWYITLFMLNRGSDSNLAFYSIAVMNGAGFVGRIASGYAGDRFGRFNTLVSVAVLQAISILALWTTSTTIAETLVFAVIYGFSSASYLAIVASCVATITPDPSQIGTRTGMFTASMGPGVLAGPAIAGALVALRSAGSADASVDGDTAQLKFLWAQAFSGSMLAVGAVFALCARVAVRRGWGKA